MDVTQTLGWIATFLFSVMVVPQMVKTIKLKDTRGVSLALFIIYGAANIIALVYAFRISQPPLIIKYIIALVTTAAYIALYIYFKKKERLVSISIEAPEKINSG